MMVGSQSQNREDLAGAMSNARVDHPEKSWGIRIVAKSSRALNPGDGQVGDPVDDGLGARDFFQPEKAAEAAENSGNRPKAKTGDAKKEEANMDDVQFALQSRRSGL
jgi:hypothetical protein